MKDIQHITSRDNPRIKLAKSVREGRQDGLIFVEGVRLAEEAIRSRLRVSEAFVSAELLGSERVNALVGALRNSGATVYSVAGKIADSLSDTKNGQGVIALAERPHSKELNELNFKCEAGIPLVLYLEAVNNPSNLGAVVRTAEAAGAVGLILSQGSADPFSPKALRASMGSSFRLPIVPDADLSVVSEWARNTGLIKTAADVSAATSHFATDWHKPRMLVMGSEANGLNAETLAAMDELTLIEMKNDVESLNLAVACGIILFEANRQNKLS